MSYEYRKYYNGNLYVGIAMDVNKSTTIYETYMWVLQWM
jgi:hypothetical protein